jgi:Glycosidases
MPDAGLPERQHESQAATSGGFHGRTRIFIAALVLLISASIFVMSRYSAATHTGSKGTVAVPSDPFQERNGWFYHYVRANDLSSTPYPATTYFSITAKINDDFYSDRGASNIMIYGPYKASEEFRGLPAIDFFEAQVGTGTVQDFRDMVAAAHIKGLTVTIYMCLLYVHNTNSIFLNAEADARDGVDSPEVNMFRWSPTKTKPKASQNPPDFPAIEGGWAFSQTAQRWYATSWGFPAPDYAKLVTRNYVKDVLRFWLATGVDGIEQDFPGSFLGMPTNDWTFVDPNMVDILITTPITGTPNRKWLHAEGAGTFGNEGWNDDVGFNHILINGDEDHWSFAYAVMDEGPKGLLRRTVDQLEEQWRVFFDVRRARNPDLGVNAWSLYVPTMTPEQRALDAAVQAGMGALYSTDIEEIYSRLSAVEQQQYDDVFRALQRSRALAPGASRVRRPATICGGGSATQVYAIERTSTDGTRTALNIYNFKSKPQCVTVNLSGSIITVPQAPINLSTQQSGPPITSMSYDVQLPAFGYLFLDVATK